MKCEYCGSIDFILEKGAKRTGLYCKNCLRWKKWIKKKELPLYKVMYEE